MTKLDIEHIVVDETTEYSISRKEGDEGIGVKVSHFKKDGEYHPIAEIDGLTKEQMKDVRQFTIKLLRYIQSQIQEEKEK